jgi:hypothetical protein
MLWSQQPGHSRLKHEEQEGRDETSLPRGEARSDPEQNRTLRGKIEDHYQAARAKGDAKNMESRGLQPITARRAHVGKEVDIRPQSACGSLGRFQQDAFVVGEHQPVALKRENDGRDHDKESERGFQHSQPIP